ncbi:MAG TPA: SulP family inorganic anion transporter [Acidimicrobiales bacterium]|nr:SulP family inorganic anion transporter [Acidimicrobiales bacterium]
MTAATGGTPGTDRPARGRRLLALLPSADDYAGLRRSWPRDVAAGLTVGVVALPLALAFGITTGLGASAGLATAIVAGLVAAVFGGSDVQVSGPTGAMTVVLVPVVARYGTDAVFVVGIIAGILVVAAGVVRLGRTLAYVPWPVVEGFTVGIAVIILLQQVPGALGVARPEGENTAAVAVQALVHAGAGSWATIAVTAATILVVVLVPRLHRRLPASLIAVAVATVVAEIAGLGIGRIGDLPNALPRPGLPSASFAELRGLVSAGFAVAVLAALESLLSAKVADGMVGGRRRHDPDRELVGQGLANLASAVFGGMPATGAIARTAVNVRAGAVTRVAAMVHAVVLAAVAVLAAGVVGRIPLAALAGVLMVTAVRMVEVHNVRAVLHATRSDAAVLTLTAVATVAFDLIVAIEIGITAAAFLSLRSVARTMSAAPEPIDDAEDVDTGRLLHEGIVAYRLDGALFFGAAQRFLTELTAVTDARVAILRLPDLQVLDATGAQALGEIVAELEGRGVTVLLKGPRPEHVRVLEAVGALDRLAHRFHLFSDLDEALAHARRHAARTALAT